MVNKTLARIPKASDVFSLHAKDPHAWRFGCERPPCVGVYRTHSTQLRSSVPGVVLKRATLIAGNDSSPDIGTFVWFVCKELLFAFVVPCTPHVALHGLVQLDRRVGSRFLLGSFINMTSSFQNIQRDHTPGPPSENLLFFFQKFCTFGTTREIV